jgi:basic membrane protein A
VKTIPESVFLSLQAVKDGTFQTGTVEYGIEDDATGISSFNQFDSVVPQAVKNKVAEEIGKMKAGKVKIATTRADLGM